MNTKKPYEFKLSRIQALVLLLTLTGCVVLAFTLGAFMGRSLIHNPGNLPADSPVRQTPLPDNAVSDYGTFEPLDTTAFDSGQTASEFSFYDDLPQKADVTGQHKTDQPKIAAKPSPASNKNAAIDKPSAIIPGATAYTIQIAAFRQKEKAHALAESLTKRGYPTQVTSTTNAQGEAWYRVRVGRFAKPEDAQRLLPALSEVSPAPRIISAEE